MSDIIGEFRNIAETLFNKAAGGFAGLPAPAAQKAFISVCYGARRAKTVKGIGNTLRAAFDAALERALKIAGQKETLPKWVMATLVEKEIPCPASEYYDILNRIKPGYLRYGVSFDNRYAAVFLEQEIHAASMIKYGAGGYSLDDAQITDYLRVQGGGGTGVTFRAPKPDSPVILFEVKSCFYGNGEYLDIDSSPASLNAGLRKFDFEAKPELRVETARRVVAACFAADCGAGVSSGGNIPPQKWNIAPAAQPVSEQIDGDDEAARFSAALPSVIFPEMAMFFESPETAAYGVYVRGKNFDARDREAARLFTDYYNHHKNSMKSSAGAGTEPKIITTRYNPNARKIAETYGLAEDEYENAYDFFQDAAQTDARKIGTDEAEEIFSKVIHADWRTRYTCQKVEYENRPEDFEYKFLKGDVCEASARFEDGALSRVSRYDSVKQQEKCLIYDCRGFLSCERLIASEERLALSETFFTPSGEKVIEKSYRVEDGKSDVMAARVKFEGTWRCFSDEDELLAFYSEKSAACRNGAGLVNTNPYGNNSILPDSKEKTYADTMITPDSKEKSYADTMVTPDSKEKTYADTMVTPESQEKTYADTMVTPDSQEKSCGNSGITLSVIIPHYDRAELIMMCLDSIAVNDYPQELYEVIVVDDCSKKSIDSIRAYSKIKNFRFCQLTKNSGAASAPRNYGITQARGEYVMFIDSDDMISARLLSESMKIARAGGCDAVVIPKISRRSTAAAFRTLTDDLTKIKLDGLSDLSVLVASDNYAIGKLFRMDLVRRFGIRFPENLVYSEDTCFCRWFYAVSKTMGICASESYFLRDWDEGTLSHYKMSRNDLYEHVSFITRNIFGVPDEFAPIDKKARAMDGSIKNEAVRAALSTPYYAALLKEKYGPHFAAMRDAPRISKETREFADTVINAKPAARSKEKSEIVFMPYRASTWDSLESIWLAAKDDPDCDVYVVPLPYRDPESGELACDAKNLPGYVPVTPHGEYDHRGRLPDIVYINDPYDQYREIAPIDSAYYSYNLKKYTGMLVYVPYHGANVGVNPNSEVYKAFVYVSAHADKLITQSERFSALYAKEAAPNKLAALGSPKIDKLVNAEKEAYPLPEEWKRIVGNKKIILYNTHLVNIRDPKRDMVAKLRYVMGVFEKRGDAVLWWRPHPSIEAELKTRNPRGFEVYRRLTEEYKAAGIGIYDDTPEPHRALVWSDAYYGDGSSLMYMCGVAGKPMMLQDAVRKDENSGDLPSRPVHDLLFCAVHDDGENFWFTAEGFNALFKMNKQNWTPEYMGSFPNELNKIALYRQAIEHGGKLYFTPLSADEIGVYDIAAKKFEKISIAEPENCVNKDGYNPLVKFAVATAYGKYIFFVGYSYPAIMRLNTESGHLDYFTDWVEPLPEISGIGNVRYFLNAAISGNKIFMPSLNANAVAAFDMDECVTCVYEVGNKEQKYAGICSDGENYWLIPRRTGAVVRWNPVTKECKEYSGYPTGFKVGNPNFSVVKYWDGYIWLLPFSANMALKIDVSDGSMSIAEEFMGECEFKGKKAAEWNYYLLSLTAADKLYAHTGKSNRFTEYDFKTKLRREEGIAISEDVIKELKLNENFPALFYKNVRWRLSVHECNFHEIHSSLQDFLNYAVNESDGKAAFSAKQVKTYGETAANVDGTCGAKVHKYVKNEARRQ